MQLSTASTQERLIFALFLAGTQIVLNTIVSLFSEYCDKQYTVEPVEVEDPLGHMETYPKLESKRLDLHVDEVKDRLGITVSAGDAAYHLGNMMLPSKPGPSSKWVSVEVPPLRADVMHSCDVIEAIAVSYGYNNIPLQEVDECTVAAQRPLNVLADLVRGECANMGFTEVLTWVLLSKDDNFYKLKRLDPSLFVAGVPPSFVKAKPMCADAGRIMEVLPWSAIREPRMFNLLERVLFPAC